MRTHKDLEVWKKAISLITNIYSITKMFPTDELYGLTQQIRRSAVSIPSNIAEGAARQHKNEFIQFLYIALGSLSELETQWLISKNWNFISVKDFNIVSREIQEIRKMLLGLISYLKNQTKN